MDNLLQTITDFIARHHGWAGLVLGVVVFLESLVLVGAFLPATALMIMAGGLIAAGSLNPIPVLMWCIGGAILGDALSYLLGRKLGARTLRAKMFARHRRTIARTRLFFGRYGLASIYLGRFFGPLRAFVPLMAGMMRMKSRNFQIANIGSAFLWVPVMLAPGYLAAKGLEQLESLSEAHLITLLALIAVVIAGAVILARRLMSRAARSALKVRPAETL